MLWHREEPPWAVNVPRSGSLDSVPSRDAGSGARGRESAGDGGAMAALDRIARAGVAASSSRLGGLFYHHVSRRIDRFLIPWTSGRLAMGPPGQTLLLTTTGARSGKRRVASLAFLWEGDDIVVVASKGGADHHPAWYHNLKTDPCAVVQHRGGVEKRRARETSGDERDRLFARAASTWDNFSAYQRRAKDRAIPVMILSRDD